MLVQSHATGCRTTTSEPLVIGIGSGGASLERYIETRTGIPILASDLVPPTDTTVRWRYANMRNLPFAKGSKQVVLSSFAMGYVGRAAFAEAYRVLAPAGGTLIALVHCWGGLARPYGISYAFGCLMRSVLACAPLAILRNTAALIGALSFRGLSTIITALPTRVLFPKVLRYGIAFTQHLYRAMNRTAFRTQKEVHTLLQGIGFNEITVETAHGRALVDWLPDQPTVGWIVVAHKPHRKG